MQTNRKTVSWRSEAHADIADTPAFRQHVQTLVERNFGLALVKELRARGGRASIQELTEEWLNSGDGGRVYEIRADVVDLPA
jgi:hypothetical protein